MGLASAIPDIVTVVGADAVADAVAVAGFAMIHGGPSLPHILLQLRPGTHHNAILAVAAVGHMIGNFHSHSCFVGFAVAAKTDFGRRNIIVIADVDIQADDTVLNSSSGLGLKLSWLHNQNCIIALTAITMELKQRQPSSTPLLMPPSL